MTPRYKTLLFDGKAKVFNWDDRYWLRELYPVASIVSGFWVKAVQEGETTAW